MKANIKKAFEIYKKHFVKIAVLILMIWVPLSVVDAFVLAPEVDIDYCMEVIEKASAEGGEIYKDEAAAVAESVMVYFAATMLMTIIGFIAEIAVIKLSASEARGETELCNISDSFEIGVKSFPRVLWALILNALVVLAGFLLILPGIFLALMSMFTVTAVVVSGMKGMKAVLYSLLLSKDKLLEIVIVFVVFVAANYGLSELAARGISIIPAGDTVRSVIAVAVSLVLHVLMAFQTVLFTVMFLEREKKISVDIMNAINKKPGTDTTHVGEQ